MRRCRAATRPRSPPRLPMAWDGTCPEEPRTREVAAAATPRSGRLRAKNPAAAADCRLRRWSRLALAGLLLLGGGNAVRRSRPGARPVSRRGRRMRPVPYRKRRRARLPMPAGASLDTEFGRISPPRTSRPTAQTGIGGWSEADFVRAMRWGIAPDDSHYLPVFPFAYYNRLTDRDLADIKAFLDTLPPVSRPELPRSSMALWERARAAVAIAATPMPGSWRDDPTRDAGMESRRLSRRHDRPLRRVPYAAHLAWHPRSGSLSRGRPRPERAAAAPNITSDRESRDRQLEHRRHRHDADRRHDPEFRRGRSQHGRDRQEHGQAERGGSPGNRGLPAIRAARSPGRSGSDRSSVSESACRDRLLGIGRFGATSYDARTPARRDPAPARGGELERKVNGTKSSGGAVVFAAGFSRPGRGSGRRSWRARDPRRAWPVSTGSRWFCPAAAVSARIRPGHTPRSSIPA